MSPASTSMTWRLKVVTVSAPRCLRSSPGILRITASGTRRSGGGSTAASTSVRSEVWWCSSRGMFETTTCFFTPESSVKPAPSITPAPAGLPPVRIWWPASDFGGRAMTSQSVTGRVWQPSRNRSRTSSWPSWRVSCTVAGGTSPERILHRQLRQRPRAPQVASMPTPAARAASSSEAPRPMRARRTAFVPSGSTNPTSIRFDSGIPSGLLEASWDWRVPLGRPRPSGRADPRFATGVWFRLRRVGRKSPVGDRRRCPYRPAGVESTA